MKFFECRRSKLNIQVSKDLLVTEFHIAPTSGLKSNKYQLLSKKSFCANPKPQFVFVKLSILDFLWKPPILKKVEKNQKRSGQLQHPTVYLQRILLKINRILLSSLSL